MMDDLTSVKTANASSRPIFFTINARAYRRKIINRPVKHIMKMIPTMAELSRDSARYSSETPLGILPAASAARISSGIVIDFKRVTCSEKKRYIKEINQGDIAHQIQEGK
jgi:hypothetical protein